MGTWDIIIVGGGIIGLSLSVELRKRGATVLIIERGEPGREASSAAAGMLADCAPELPPALQPLATASARMYPEFVHGLQDESGMDVDLRDNGTILFAPTKQIARTGGDASAYIGSESNESHSPVSIKEHAPALADLNRPAFYLKERSVDPRALVQAALKAAKHRGVDIVSGSEVTEVLSSEGRITGVRTDKSTYHTANVVNCAGAWAGKIPPHSFPTRPVKGQILSIVGVPHGILRHVLRTPEVYLVPRSDGRILIGATLEDAGFDKRTDAETIHRLYLVALRILPALNQGRILEAWAGLRPGTPDHLPILGATASPGYFVATGHFRDGILLAPVTAHLMAQIITRSQPELDISVFSPARFPH